MKVVFHADDRPASGLGHVVRTRALADAFSLRGHKVTFVESCAVIAESADLVVVDSYAITSAEIASFATVAPVCVIDDIGDRDLSRACAIVNQNFGAELRTYPRGPHLLLGPQFALLRPVFAGARRGRVFSNKDDRVLITLGGAPVQAKIDALAAALASAGRLLEIVTLDGKASAAEVAAAMSESSLAVSAAGVTLLELAAVGTPAVIVTVAENQEPGAAAAASSQLAIFAGPLDQAVALVATEVERLLDAPAERERLSRRMMAAVDGKGTTRVVERLEAIAAM